MTNIKKIGIIGGSGALGSALAHRFIKESFEVTIGSRSPEKVISKISEADKDLDLQSLKIQEIAQTADKAKNAQYGVEDLRGGTFTISNLGAIGGTYSTPIINYPEVAILLVGRSRKLPVVHEDRVEPRLMMPLSLSYDHRVIDGAMAARFLKEVIGYLESPGRLLLAM